MTADHGRRIPWPSAQQGAPVPQLPLLRHESSPAPAAWLQQAMTTFAASVASFLPGHYAAYARLHHPFRMGGLDPAAPGTWQELAARHGRDIRDPMAVEGFALDGVPDAQARIGTLSPEQIDVCVEHLRSATETPEQCYFALWTGFGGSAVPHDLQPQLRLPNREYHLFSGPLEAARTSYHAVWWVFQSANLWWPADRAWCVASEIDHAWSYVGGGAPLIETILGDARLDAARTSAGAVW